MKRMWKRFYSKKISLFVATIMLLVSVGGVQVMASETEHSHDTYSTVSSSYILNSNLTEEGVEAEINKIIDNADTDVVRITLPDKFYDFDYEPSDEEIASIIKEIQNESSINMRAETDVVPVAADLLCSIGLHSTIECVTTQSIHFRGPNGAPGKHGNCYIEISMWEQCTKCGVHTSDTIIMYQTLNCA